MPSQFAWIFEYTQRGKHAVWSLLNIIIIIYYSYNIYNMCILYSKWECSTQGFLKEEIQNGCENTGTVRCNSLYKRPMRPCLLASPFPTKIPRAEENPWYYSTGVTETILIGRGRVEYRNHHDQS